MKSTQNTLAVILILVMLGAPILAHAFSIVPCTTNCTFDDLVVTLIRLINFLFAAAAVVAIYHILLSAWTLMSSMGNPEKLTGGKEGVTRAVIGFAIILLSFTFVNLLLGIFGITCPWWTRLSCLAG